MLPTSKANFNGSQVSNHINVAVLPNNYVVVAVIAPVKSFYPFFFSKNPNFQIHFSEISIQFFSFFSIVC